MVDSVLVSVRPQAELQTPSVCDSCITRFREGPEEASQVPPQLYYKVAATAFGRLRKVSEDSVLSVACTTVVLQHHGTVLAGVLQTAKPRILAVVGKDFATTDSTAVFVLVLQLRIAAPPYLRGFCSHRMSASRHLQGCCKHQISASWYL